jgi:uncharacterized protein (DUF885 family)
MMNINNWGALLAFLAVTALAHPGVSQAQKEAEVVALDPEPISRLANYIENYYADLEALDREYVLEESPQYYERMATFYDRWLEKLSQMDYESLSVDESVDFILLRRNIRRDRDEMRRARESYQEVQSVVEFAGIIENFQQKRSIGQNVDGKALSEQLDQLAASIRQERQALKEAGRLPLNQSNRAVEVAENLHETLENAYSFYKGYDPDVTWWAEEPYTDADTTLSNYISFLEEWRTTPNAYPEDESDIVGDPVGRERLMELLEYAMIPYTPEELVEIAEQEYEFSMQQMLAASRQLGYGDDWKAALNHVKNNYVPVGEKPELIYDLATGATSFLEGRDLLTIPELAKETWTMEMMSPERQLVNPYFLGGETIFISYPTNTMDHEAKLMSLRGNNPHMSKATVHHELIPGHHLQGFYSERYNTYRNPFYTPFWTEGWALYWELQLWDMGFPDSPEDRIGMLFWRMHRSARIIFSLNFHLGEMSPGEAIDFLVEKVGHEPANAEAEVRRSVATNYPPLYQAAYMLGGLQFRSMYNDMVANGDMPVKEFHDTILKEGNMPVEMTRHLLRDEKPPRDFETNWQFYEDFDYTDYSNEGE